MRVDHSRYLFVLALTPWAWGLQSDSTEPDGSPAPKIPDGFFAPNGEINDPTIPNPAPEFPAPPDGTPNISSKSHTLHSCVFTSSMLNITSVVSQSKLNDFLLLEQYAAASYCDYNNNYPQGGRRLACDNDVCPDLEPLDQVTEFEFVQ